MSQVMWSDSWPDWQDDGKRVRLLMADCTETLGTLRAEEFFTGEDEVPVFRLKTDDGQDVSFADAEKWRFEELPA